MTEIIILSFWIVIGWLLISFQEQSYKMINPSLIGLVSMAARNVQLSWK